MLIPPAPESEKPPIAPDALRYGSFVVVADAAGRPRILGEGAFGRTYLARHQYLDTMAALKVINERFARERSARERFLSEGKALVRLDHRHIARLHDFGEAGTDLFYAMEYCAGGDLFQRMKAIGALPLAEWAIIAQQLASALECCHTAGFIHRDLKPSNVMLARAEDPLVSKLIDFGLVQAEQLDPEAHARLIGTPLYASPEQLREEAIDARSDLFSLGVTLWHLALGTSPEAGNSARVIASRLSTESYAPVLPATLPEPFRVLLAALLEKDRSRRMSTASEAVTHLMDIADALGLPVLPPSGDRAAGSPAPAYSLAPAPPPVEIEQIDALLEQDFEVLASVCDQNTGVNYLARRRTGTGEEQALLHSLHPLLVANEALLLKLRTAVAQLMVLRAPFSLYPARICSYRDFTVLLLDAPAGENLVTTLKVHGKCALADVAALLRNVAAAADRHVAAGLPGLELAATRIHLKAPGLKPGGAQEPELLPRFLSTKETRELVQAVAQEDPSAATMTAELFEEEGMADHAPLQFARLIYRLAAGRDCAAAAALSTRGYVAVPDLTEGTNRLLSNVIAGQTDHTTCTGLLGDVMAGQGIGHPGASRTASRSVHATARPGSATSARIRTAPSPAMPGRGGPLSSTGTSVPAPPPTVVRTAAPPPPPLPRAVAGPLLEPVRSKAWVRPLVIAAVGLSLVGGCLLLFAEREVKPAGSSTSSAIAKRETLPRGSAVTLEGNFPAKCTFTVGGSPVQGTRISDRAWSVPVGGLKTPVEISMASPGYQAAAFTLVSREQAKSVQPIAVIRAFGTLKVVRSRTSDYTNGWVKMVGFLPEEEGLFPLDRITQGWELRDAEKSWELPTGQWIVRLESGGHRIRSRDVTRVEIRQESEQTVILPAAFADVFQGDLRDRDGAVAAILEVEPGLVGGTVSYTKGGVARRVRLEECKLDETGRFSGIARFSHSGDAPAFDEQISATMSPDGETISVKAVEKQPLDAGTQPRMDRAPWEEKDWSRSGTLRRRKQEG